MSERRPHADHCLEFHPEQLESRQMLAGDVRVATSGDNLTLIGDNLDNNISLVHNSDGEVLLQGHDGTTVTYQGVTAVSHLLPDLGTDAVVNRLRIVLKDGNDRIAVNGIHAVRATINGGKGDDYIYSASASFDQYSANGNSGFDEVQVTGVEMGRVRIDVEFTLLAFSDFTEELAVRSMNKTELTQVGSNNYVGILNSRVLDGMRITMGSGTDQVGISNSEVNGDSRIKLGSGRDYISVSDSNLYEDVRIDMGRDNDRLVLSSQPEFFGQLEVYGRSGNDTWEILFAAPSFHGESPVFDSIEQV